VKWCVCACCEQQQAAATTVYCATCTELQSTTASNTFYFNNCFQCVPSPEATNPTTAKWLWELSEQMISRAKTLTCKPTTYDVWLLFNVQGAAFLAHSVHGNWTGWVVL